MSDNKPIYMAYLLRLWEEDDYEYDDIVHAPVWRASLEDVFTHERNGFEGLRELFEFLEKQTVSASQEHHAEHVSSKPD